MKNNKQVLQWIAFGIGIPGFGIGVGHKENNMREDKKWSNQEGWGD